MGREKITNASYGLKKVLYATLNAITSFGLFYIIYRLYLESIRVYWIIFVCLVGTSVIGSFLVRWFLKFWDNSTKNIQQLVQNFIIPIIWAGLVWLGLVTMLFDKYETGTISLGMFVFIFLLMKSFVFFASDYIADTITFQG